MWFVHLSNSAYQWSMRPEGLLIFIALCSKHSVYKSPMLGYIYRIFLEGNVLENQTLDIHLITMLVRVLTGVPVILREWYHFVQGTLRNHFSDVTRKKTGTHY